MSIHPSLAASKSKKHRSVSKRYERIEELKKEGKWKEELSPFGLPKGKINKIKLKKVKAAAEKTTEAAAPGATTTAATTKPAAPAAAAPTAPKK